MSSLMSTKILAGTGLIVGSTLVFTAAPAQALTIQTHLNTPLSNVAGAQTITFDDVPLGNLVNGYTHSSGISYQGVGGEVAINNTYPFPADGGYNTFNNPILRSGYQNRESLEIDLGRDSEYFGFYFAYIDNFNNIDIYDGDNLLQSLTGGDIKAIHGAPVSLLDDALFVDIFADAGESFDRVIFQSDRRGFESDNHAYLPTSHDHDIVPTPTAVLPLLSGLFASAKRRRKHRIAEDLNNIN